MRARSIILIAIPIILGVLTAPRWDWNWVPYIDGVSPVAVARNMCAMTEDVIECLEYGPSLDRLEARAYVARALASGDYPGLAIRSEVEDFDKAIQLDPKYVRAYVYHACGLNHIYHHLFEKSDAEIQHRIICDLKTAIELDPQGKLADMAYSELESEYENGSRQPAKALAVCDMAILNLAAEDVSHHYYFRGWIHGKMGMHLEESKDYGEAAKLEAKSAWNDIRNDLAWCVSWAAWLILLVLSFDFNMIRRTPVVSE